MSFSTSEDVLASFAKLGLDTKDVFEHDEVLTCQAQVDAVGSDAGIVTKNLFFQDKRKRHYMFTAAHDTAIDLKMLSLRLGLKKGELRAASEEQLLSVLGVAAGCVTPVATCQPSAERVLLLIDAQLQSGPFLVHPMRNTASMRITHQQLSQYLRSAGRDAHFIDFSVGSNGDLKLGPDNPPDLKCLADAIPAEKEVGVWSGVAPGTMPGRGGAKKPAAVQAAPKASAPPAVQQDSIPELLDLFVAKMNACMVEASGSEATAAQVTRLRKDLDMELNAFRNASYSRGMQAAKGAMMAKLTKEWN